MIDVERTINTFLQRNTTFLIDNKSIKKGKLVLFNVKDFYLIFHLKSGNDQKKYELPYPFKVYMEEGKIVLDYTIDTLSQNNDNLLYRIMSLNRKKNSKIFNSKIVIQDTD